MNRFVVPGDSIKEDIELLHNKRNRSKLDIKCGVGIIPRGKDVVGLISGYLRTYTQILKNGKSMQVHYILGNNRFYIPRIGDRVLGIVERRVTPDKYFIDINSNFSKVSASLWRYREDKIRHKNMAILILGNEEYGIKRKSSLLEIGDIVYGRITITNKDIDTLVKTNEDVVDDKFFGPKETLKNGLLLTCGSLLCFYLTREECPIINIIEKKLLNTDFRVEMIVGLNNRVWIRIISISRTQRAVLTAEDSKQSEIEMRLTIITSVILQNLDAKFYKVAKMNEHNEFIIDDEILYRIIIEDNAWKSLLDRI